MAAFPMPPPSPPPSWAEKWSTAHPGSGLALILNMVRDIQASSQGGRTLVDTARQTYSGAPGSAVMDLLSLGPLAPAAAISPSFRQATSSPDLSLFGLAGPIGALDLRAATWRPPTPSSMAMEQRFGRGAWFSPTGKEVGLKPDVGSKGIATHGITAMELTDAAPLPGAAIQATNDLLDNGWVRLRGNAVQATVPAMDRLPFHKAIQRAAESAKARGGDSIVVEIFPEPKQGTRSRIIPIRDLPEFLEAPVQFLQRAP